MNNKGQELAIAVMAALTVASSTAALADSSTGPQCFGIAKASKNACGTVDHSDNGVLVKGHACAGLATQDANCYEWLPIPAPLCPTFVVTIGNKDYSGFTSSTACLEARGLMKAPCPTPAPTEKCYGITKQTSQQNWVNVPQGACITINGGRLTP